MDTISTTSRRPYWNNSILIVPFIYVKQQSDNRFAQNVHVNAVINVYSTDQEILPNLRGDFASTGDVLNIRHIHEYAYFSMFQ